ncbi:MAG: hypothetical protein D6721_04385 [Gammaproteobacteria bacterium]|nr:MAG: hypothetical protein D6721_04385 [Gammaproteobacteria bacterium]
MLQRNLIVTIDGQRRIEFDRSGGIPARERTRLEDLDRLLDEEGVHLNGRHIARPDGRQKAYFMIEYLLNVLLDEDMERAALVCTYVGRRLPNLVGIHARSQGDRLDVNLQFD